MHISSNKRLRLIPVLAGMVFAATLLVAPVTSQAASLSELSKAKGKKFARLIAKSDRRAMRNLWNIKTKRRPILTIFKEQNVSAINKYISTKSKGKYSHSTMKNAVYFLQIAYYHNAYNPRELGYSETVLEESCKALAKVGQSKLFYKSTKSAQELRVQWGISIDSTGALPYCLPTMTKMINRYIKNRSLSKHKLENEAMIKIMYSIGRQGRIRKNQDPSSKWYKAFEGKPVKALARLAMLKRYKEGSIDVIQNTIWNMGKGLSNLSPKTKKQVHYVVSNAFKTHKKSSGPWVWSGKTLVEYFDSKTAAGKKVSPKVIRKAQILELFPKTYKYQKGKVILRCSLSKERADHLGKALTLVRKEFFKICPNKRPVRGDKNKTITIYIYPTPKSYKTIHPGLFNTSVQNGGIFIESRGHIYTFDRDCPRENIYTLEELVRHEYTHYLDSRYNLYGGFNGRGTPFKMAPIAWYLEGLAEALTGATPGKGILPRYKMIKDVRRLMPLSKLTRCTYERDGFSFYSDGSILFCFLANKKPALLKQMFKALRSNKKEKIQAIFEKLRTDPEFEKEYENYFNYLKKAYRQRKKIFFEDHNKLT